MLVRKYFVVDTNTGEHMHRDFIAENRIKRSYAWQRMEESLESEDPPQNDDFYTDLGLPPMPLMNSTHFDDAGREWKYTIKGWEIIPNEYDPVVKMESKLEVVVAHKSKQSWFDLTNKSLFPEYKWDWFEKNVSGDTGWGNSKVDHGLGNERGEDSHIYGSWDNGGLGINRPGSGATFNNVLTNINRIANFIRGFRIGRGTIQHGTAIYDEFKPKTQYQLDSIYSDSIFQNEEIEIRREKFKFGLHKRREWGFEKEPEVRFIDEPLIIIRKDSAKIVKENYRINDSIRKSYGLK